MLDTCVKTFFFPFEKHCTSYHHLVLMLKDLSMPFCLQDWTIGIQLFLASQIKTFKSSISPRRALLDSWQKLQNLSTPHQPCVISGFLSLPESNKRFVFWHTSVCIHDNAPLHLKEVLTPHIKILSIFSNNSSRLQIPRTKLMRNRSFYSAAPRLWDSLPHHLRNCRLHNVLKKKD